MKTARQRAKSLAKEWGWDETSETGRDVLTELRRHGAEARKDGANKAFEKAAIILQVEVESGLDIDPKVGDMLVKRLWSLKAR